MAIEFYEILILKESLQIPPIIFQPDAGAIVEFLGVVRNTEGDEQITGIDYEANIEMALHQLRKLAHEARNKFSYENLILHHRIGFVPIAEPSLFVRVIAKHRGPAFATCQWTIDQLKEVVPIWKRVVKEL